MDLTADIYAIEAQSSSCAALCPPLGIQGSSGARSAAMILMHSADVYMACGSRSGRPPLSQQGLIKPLACTPASNPAR